jgi:MtaA/CmuA family methyltransferase
MTPKERLYATINGSPCDRPAVTPIFMAWAAHFINRSYRDYYLDSNVLVEAQLAVTRAFNLDQISAISDPWREASAYGMEFDYPQEGVGKPKATLLNTDDDFADIGSLDIAASPRMQQRVNSVAAMASQVGETHSVLGWIEGPLAEYADLRGVESTMLDLIDNPQRVWQTAGILVDNAIRFAKAQIEAGADMIGIGDAVASLVGPDIYRDAIVPLECKLIAGIHEAGAKAKLHICGNIGNIIEYMPGTEADVIDVDWMVPLIEARAKVGDDVTLCGNFDPAGVLLQSSPQGVADVARACLQAGGQRFILMPGCEVPPQTPEENIRAFCPCDGSLMEYS